ncbi:MAG: biotin synthase auxiliary protein BsaP [Frankiaceae bacterium]
MTWAGEGAGAAAGAAGAAATGFCDACGRPLEDGEALEALEDGEDGEAGHAAGVLPYTRHARCSEQRTLEPPRYCPSCGRRLVVQVLPAGWTARCSQHGELPAPD